MKIRIKPDLYPDNPREAWDNVTLMVCFHKRYSLGDTEHDYKPSQFTSWEELEEQLIQDHRPVFIAPLYMYDHSGLTIRMGRGFGDIDPMRWDWGQIGFVLVPRDVALEELNRKRVTRKVREWAAEIARGEVTEYNQFLTGDVWGYEILDDAGEVIDSCWGFFGHEYAEQSAQEALQAITRSPAYATA